jgi:hypothetical protein
LKPQAPLAEASEMEPNNDLAAAQAVQFPVKKSPELSMVEQQAAMKISSASRQRKGSRS